MKNLYIENLKVRFFQDADRTNAYADESLECSERTPCTRHYHNLRKEALGR